jgi:hypothetical protein
MINYFYPDLNNSKDENQKKKFVNELLNPEQAYFEAMRKAGNMKKKKNDIMEKSEGKLLTNDGREMLNENK